MGAQSLSRMWDCFAPEHARTLFQHISTMSSSISYLCFPNSISTNECHGWEHVTILERLSHPPIPYHTIPNPPTIDLPHLPYPPLSSSALLVRTEVSELHAHLTEAHAQITRLTPLGRSFGASGSVPGPWVPGWRGSWRGLAVSDRRSVTG